jgi:hypothetical protein
MVDLLDGAIFRASAAADRLGIFEAVVDSLRTLAAGTSSRRSKPGALSIEWPR